MLPANASSDNANASLYNANVSSDNANVSSDNRHRSENECRDVTCNVSTLLQVREAEPQSGAFPVEDWERDERGNVSKHFCLVTFTLS